MHLEGKEDGPLIRLDPRHGRAPGQIVTEQRRDSALGVVVPEIEKVEDLIEPVAVPARRLDESTGAFVALQDHGPIVQKRRGRHAGQTRAQDENVAFLLHGCPFDGDVASAARR